MIGDLGWGLADSRRVNRCLLRWSARPATYLEILVFFSQLAALTPEVFDHLLLLRAAVRGHVRLGLLHFAEELSLSGHSHETHRVSLHSQAASHLHLGGVCLQLEQGADSFIVGRFSYRHSRSNCGFLLARDPVLLLVHVEEICEFGLLHFLILLFLSNDLDHVDGARGRNGFFLGQVGDLAQQVLEDVADPPLDVIVVGNEHNRGVVCIPRAVSLESWVLLWLQPQEIVVLELGVGVDSGFVALVVGVENGARILVLAVVGR